MVLVAGCAGGRGHASLVLTRVRVWLGSLAFLVILTAGFGTAWGLAAAGQGPVIHREAIAVNTGNATAARLELQVGGRHAHPRRRGAARSAACR